MPQVFDEARPLIVSGENDRGLEPDPDEPTGDEVDFLPARRTTDRSRQTEYTQPNTTLYVRHSVHRLLATCYKVRVTQWVPSYIATDE